MEVVMSQVRVVQSDALRSERLVPLEPVCVVTGNSRSTIYRMIAAGSFPKPVKTSKGRVAWREREVLAWLAALSTTSPPPAIAPDAAVPDPNGAAHAPNGQEAVRQPRELPGGSDPPSETPKRPADRSKRVIAVLNDRWRVPMMRCNGSCKIARADRPQRAPAGAAAAIPERATPLPG